MPQAIRQFYRTVSTTEPVIYRLNSFSPPGLTVRLIPGSGGTLTLYYKVTSDGEWIAGPLGAVSSATNDTIISPCFVIKIVAATADGTVEIAQA
jgi:hypothetical protein